MHNLGVAKAASSTRKVLNLGMPACAMPPNRSGIESNTLPVHASRAKAHSLCMLADRNRVSKSWRSLTNDSTSAGLATIPMNSIE